jgi:hypothetical protein
MSVLPLAYFVLVGNIHLRRYSQPHQTRSELPLGANQHNRTAGWFRFGRLRLRLFSFAVASRLGNTREAITRVSPPVLSWAPVILILRVMS